MGLNPWEHIPVVRRRYALRFLAALAVILLIVGAFGGTIYAQTGDELESDVESQLVTSAETDADRIDIWFRSTERYLSSLPRSSAFRSDDRVAISDSLHRMNDRTAFEGAYYVDAETGSIHANAGTNAVITDDGRVTEAIDAQLSTVLKDDSQVVFSEAFETEAGRPAMLAVSDVPGESDHVVVGLVDRSGTIVLAEERSLLLQDDALEPETVANGTGTTSMETQLLPMRTNRHLRLENSTGRLHDSRVEASFVSRLRFRAQSSAAEITCLLDSRLTDRRLVGYRCRQQGWRL